MPSEAVEAALGFSVCVAGCVVPGIPPLVAVVLEASFMSLSKPEAVLATPGSAVLPRPVVLVAVLPPSAVVLECPK